MTDLTRAAAIVDEATRELARSNDEADRIAYRCFDERDELIALLEMAQTLRPTLLAKYGAVPECVLDYCNKARALLARFAQKETT